MGRGWECRCYGTAPGSGRARGEERLTVPWAGRGAQGHGAGIARSRCGDGGGARSAVGHCTPHHSPPRAEPPFATPLRSWGPATGRPLRAVGPRVGGSGSTPGRNAGWEGPQLRHGHSLHSHRSAAAQHGREAPDPALRQGEDPPGAGGGRAGGRGCRCRRASRPPALPSASGRCPDRCHCHGRRGERTGARRLSSAFARRRARTGRAWGTAPSASGSSWCCCSKELPSPSPPWTRRGERCPATRCRPGGVGWDSPAACTAPPGAGRSHRVGEGLRTAVVPLTAPRCPEGERRALLGRSCRGHTQGRGSPRGTPHPFARDTPGPGVPQIPGQRG